MTGLYLWAELHAPDWSKSTAAEGPIPLVSASVSRILDGAGSVQIEILGSDERAIRLLDNESRIRVYVNQNGVVRQLGAALLRKRNRRIAATGESRSFDGPDILDELKNYDVLTGRVYRNTRFEDVVTDLTSSATVLSGNWRVEVESAYMDDLIEARMDGGSVLKALQTLIKGRGLHLRQKLDTPSPLDNVVEIGKFGGAVVLQCLTPPYSVSPSVQNNDDVAFIETMSVTSDSEDIVNWILPFGNGTGVGALDLRYSTRENIRAMIGPAGQTLWYMMNEASIAAYGIRMKTVTFEDITVVSNSLAGKQQSSNMVYDAGRAYLDDHSIPQTVYRITLRKCRKTIRPGDMVNVSYRGQVLDAHGKPLPDQDIEQSFYVLKVNERVGADGGFGVSLEISNVQQQVEDEAMYVVNAVEKLKAQFRRPAIAAYWSENTWTDTMQNGLGAGDTKWANFKIEVDNSVTEITRVKIRFKTSPLYVTTGFSAPFFTASSPAVGIHDHQVNLPIFWSLTYHDQHPSGISLWVDNVNVSTQYGGPWAIAVNTAVDVECDITDLIINSSNGMYSDHPIRFQCEERIGDVGINSPLNQAWASQGNIELNVRIQGVAQTIAPV